MDAAPQSVRLPVRKARDEVERLDSILAQISPI